MTRDERADPLAPPVTPATGYSTRIPFVNRIGDIAAEAQTLFLGHGDLLKSELKQEAKKSGIAVAAIAAGALVFAVGLVLLLVGTVYLLNALVPALPLWACWFINGGVFLVLGGLVLGLGLWRISTVSVVPEKTIHSLKESVQCLLNLRK